MAYSQSQIQSIEFIPPLKDTSEGIDEIHRRICGLKTRINIIKEQIHIETKKYDNLQTRSEYGEINKVVLNKQKDKLAELKNSFKKLQDEFSICQDQLLALQKEYKSMRKNGRKKRTSVST